MTSTARKEELTTSRSHELPQFSLSHLVVKAHNVTSGISTKGDSPTRGAGGPGLRVVLVDDVPEEDGLAAQLPA